MNVLFATDGLKPAHDAGLLLEKIGNRSTLDLKVLGVSTFEILVPESPMFVVDSLDQRRAHAKEIVNSAVARFEAAGFRAEALIAEGSPGAQIVTMIEKEGADLAVVGAGSRNWLNHVLLGSASTFVLHNSPSSVLVTHEAIPGDGPGRILVAVDGSEGSRLGVEAIARLADPERASIHVISVAKAPPPPYLPLPGVAPSPLPERHLEIENALLQRAEGYAAAAVGVLREAGFTVDSEVLSGSPTREILGMAESGHFDLVAVGSRGLGPIRRALLGSVSDQVSRFARATLVARSEE